MADLTRRAEFLVSQDPERYVLCPECKGTGRVWADYNGGSVEADCPYCGDSGVALKSCVARDYP